MVGEGTETTKHELKISKRLTTFLYAVEWLAATYDLAVKSIKEGTKLTNRFETLGYMCNFFRGVVGERDSFFFFLSQILCPCIVSFTCGGKKTSVSPFNIGTPGDNAGLKNATLWSASLSYYIIQGKKSR